MRLSHSFILLVFYLLAACLTGFAQTNEKQLLEETQKASGDKKALLLNQLSETALYNSAEKSFEYGVNAVESAKTENSPEQLATAYLNIANALRIMGEYNSAIDTLYKTIPIIQNLNNKRLVVNILNVIGLCHQDLKHDTLSMETYVQSLGEQRFKKSADIAGLTETLAELYFKTGNYSKSLEFYMKALRFYQISGNSPKVAEMFFKTGNIRDIFGDYELALVHYKQAIGSFNLEKLKNNILSLSYFNSGRIYFEKRDFSEALQNFQLIPGQLSLVTDSGLIAKSYVFIGRVYAQLQEPQKAVENFKTALQLASYGSEENVLAQIELGNLLFRQKQYQPAFQYFLQASKIALKQGMDETAITALKGLAGIYTAKGNFVEANRVLNSIIQYNDSLASKNKKEQLGEQEKQYHWESRETRIETLNKEKKIQRLQVEKQRVENKLLIVALAAMALLILLMVRLYYLRTKTNRLLKIKSERIHLRNTKLSHINEELKTMNEQLASSEENLRGANATKDKMFSIIAHDLRNPLISLKNMIFILRSGPDALEKEEKEEYLQQLDRSLLGAIELMNNLFNWALAQQGSLRFKPERINLKGLVLENANVCKPLSELKKISLSIDLQENSTLLTDKNMLDFVVRNILSNAIKFTPPGGEIKICGKQDNGFYQIEIKDSGIGLSPIEIENLLSKNDMLSREGTQNEKGSGLGLMVCKDFIARMDGKLFIESQPGEGTRFILKLPLQA